MKSQYSKIATEIREEFFDRCVEKLKLVDKSSMSLDEKQIALGSLFSEVIFDLAKEYRDELIDVREAMISIETELRESLI